MDIVFRDVPRQEDVEAVGDMVAGTGYFRPDEVGVARELVEERLVKGIESGYHFLFAEQEGRLAGYVCYGPIPCTVNSFDLYWIVVDNSMQGRGIGRILAAETEKAAAAMGGKRIYVETSGKEQYRSTRAFYESIGYFRAAELPDFYDIGDAKIVYQKNLGEPGPR